MRTFRVHKTRGTCKIVNVCAERVEFNGGAALFWTGDLLVMAYSAWAWKSISNEDEAA